MPIFLPRIALAMSNTIRNGNAVMIARRRRELDEQAEIAERRRQLQEANAVKPADKGENE